MSDMVARYRVTQILETGIEADLTIGTHGRAAYRVIAQLGVAYYGCPSSVPIRVAICARAVRDPGAAGLIRPWER